MKKIAIIGGGISGLSAAYYLVKHGISPTLIERNSHLGGVVRTDYVEGCTLECGPDSFLAAKPAAMDLINDLGLGSEVIGSNDHQRVTYIKKNGKLIPMPDGLMMMVPTKVMPVALSPLLGLGTKMKMGFDFFRSPGAPLPDRSVADFVVDHYGQEAVDYLAEPLLSGVYGGDPRELSVGSVLPQFVQLENKYGSLTKGVLAGRKNPQPGASSGPLFRTLKRGLGHIVEGVTERINGKAEIIHTAADAVERMAGGWRIKLNGDWLEAEQLIFACPAYQAGALLKDTDAALGDTLGQVQYNSSMTLALGYKRATFPHPLNGFGFLIPKVERKKLVACTWVHRKFSHRVPDDLVVLRCFLGGGSMNDSDQELIAAVRAEILELMNVDVEPVFHRIYRWPRSMAQYTVGHAARMKTIKEKQTALPGLHLIGNAYEGIGVPDCIRMGRAISDRIAQTT